MTAVFLETSALLRALFGEEGGSEVSDRLVRADRIVASRLLKVETERAIHRRALDDADFEKHVAAMEHEARELWARMDLVELSREICDAAGRIAPRLRLRALDALHLATFRRVQEVDPAIEMMTFDERLRAAL